MSVVWLKRDDLSSEGCTQAINPYDYFLVITLYLEIGVTDLIAFISLG